MKNLLTIVVTLLGFIFCCGAFAQEQETAVAVQSEAAILSGTPVPAMTEEQAMLAAVEATTPTPANRLPENASFHSAQHPEWPPLPGDVWLVPGWNLGGNMVLLDDRNIDFNALRAEAEAAGLMRPMFSGLSLLTISTNDLALEMICVTNGTASLVIHPPWNQTNSVWDLFYCTNIASPAWSYVLRSEPGQTNLTVANATDAQGFYRLASPNDSTAISCVGTDFWIAFYFMMPNDTNGFSLAISSPVGATGTVTIPGLSITKTFSVAAGGVTNISIPFTAMMFDYDVVETNGIHITASAPVAVYALNYDAQLSSAFTCYPTSLLGTDYFVMARAPLVAGPDNVYGTMVYSQFAIVATADGTTVTITPSPTADLAGSYWTNSFILQQGQTYQINGNDDGDDVTGTRVTADKPVAVFAGASYTVVPIGVAAANPLVQEQLPVSSWGTQALSIGFAGRTNGDTYRVLAAYSNTVVTITGLVVMVDEDDDITMSNEVVVTNLNAGQFYETILQGPAQFQATKPIQVAHFANGIGFDANGNEDGDPCEILLPPTGHYLETNIVYTPTVGFDKNYLNVIVAQSAITNTLVDSSHIAATNFIAIGTSGYYGTQITITNSGAHKVTSSQPVGVEVYGWGNVDAYGYFGGVVK